MKNGSPSAAFVNNMKTIDGERLRIDPWEMYALFSELQTRVRENIVFFHCLGLQFPKNSPGIGLQNAQ